MVLADFAEGIVGAMGAVAVAGLGVQERTGIRRFPAVVHPNFFANTTLNYHILPAFLQRLRAQYGSMFHAKKNSRAMI